MAVGKVLQDCRAIVTDGSQLNPLFLKSLFRILQLDELRFAERSPVGGAEEKKNGSIRSPQGLVGLRAIKLIAQRKGGLLHSNRQADGSRTRPSACAFLLGNGDSEDAEKAKGRRY